MSDATPETAGKAFFEEVKKMPANAAKFWRFRETPNYTESIEYLPVRTYTVERHAAAEPQ